MYGEGVGGMGQEPGFRVVKKNEVKETNEHEPITDLNVKEWEVRSTQLKQFLHFTKSAHVVLSWAKRTWIKWVLHCALIHILWSKRSYVLKWLFIVIYVKLNVK